MLKWSPDPFDQEPTGDHDARGFRREAGFADTKALMNSLTAEERSQVYELVEIDLATEYEARTAQLKTEYEESLVAAKAEADRLLDQWTDQFTGAFARELKEAAAAAARLSVQLAAKIIRGTVAVDPLVLARVIETTLYKVTESAPLTIRANPDDAAWLEQQPELRDKLNIGEIQADRRIDAGGCVMKNAGREWDATLERQLDSLGEIVTDMIAANEVDHAALLTATQPDETTPATETEVGDVPGME